MANEVISNSNSIVLDWADRSGDSWKIQVSKSYLDFRAILLVDTTVGSSTHSFSATGNAKYFWKVSPRVGGTYQPWGEVNSFIVNLSASADVSATGWILINKSDITDVYLLEEQPVNQPIVVPEHLWEAFRRNRAGNLLTEHYKTKGRISIDLTKPYLGNNQKAEIMRFYNAHISFYLATRYDNQTGDDYIYRIWECMFASAPQLDIPGGNSLEFEEV